MIWLWWITIPTSYKVSYNTLTLSVGQCMWKELESNSGPLSRSYGLEMIGFPILYWEVLHDESSLHSKSTPIKRGLFIPLWDILWMFAWNTRFHPLSLFTSKTVAFARISMMRACVFVFFHLRVLPCALSGLYLFQAYRFTFYSHSRAWVCVCGHVGMCVSCHSVFTV